jgi:hypothetical protein
MALEMQAVEQGPEEGVELALAKVAMEAVAAAAPEAAVAAIREELLSTDCIVYVVKDVVRIINYVLYICSV